MSNDGGIKAQYGFYFQKLVFIWYMLSNVSRTNNFVYEGKEDIDIDENDEDTNLVSFKNENLEDIQVKSGKVTRLIWAKVVENWMVLEDQNRKTLVAENDFEYEINSDETINYILKNIKEGKQKKKTAISRQAYDNLNNKFGYNEDQWKKQIQNTVNNAKIIVKSLDEVEKEIENTYKADYCSDICTYEEAKNLRVDSFKKECINRIEKFMGKKRPAVFKYNDVTAITLMVNDNISDHKYQVNVEELTPNKRKTANQLLSKERLREITQLKAVNPDPNFIVRELVREVFYKDFREVYADTTKKTEIGNLEYEAFSNYEDTKDDLKFDGKYTSHNLFLRTTQKNLMTSQLFPGGPIYNHGCYVYMTGQNINKDIRISWKED
ncbi:MULTISPECIES: hypothetical protein [Lactobacillus]|uniref:hypothetical protein n=1 Tax=Lactobacillus TaxID=1578 RepID=UPI0019202D17|nr:hypothetical protein [Lactobacillus sp. A27]MBL1059369.1 hypothetical protein [Lactobacillus sp. A27]